MFEVCAPFPPAGDQPEAIKALASGGEKQVLLGVTGSGKTFTMAHFIASQGKPTLVLAHNKTLAAQLYQELSEFFPHNAVEYFVSYYDYYQPEAYIARTDTYIEKDMAINDRIDRLRLQATRALIERQDVIIVSSVSCIYGLGLPEQYIEMKLPFTLGDSYELEALALKLVSLHYTRNDHVFERGTFRIRGDVIDIFPSYEEERALRIEFFGEEIERIREIDPLTGRILGEYNEMTLYPATHHVMDEATKELAVASIKQELQERVKHFERLEQHVEKERLLTRTTHDLEMLQEVGTFKGIENYSRHFGQRAEGSPPPTLIDYFPEDFLLIVDESHQTIPQIHAMYNGDRMRKQSLVEYGFRLPSAYDNRPLTFEEFYRRINQVLYVSATPGSWEVEEVEGRVIEQIMRPTGLLDPVIELCPATGQVDDCLERIQQQIEKGGRVLLITLTKKLAEDMTGYLLDLGVKAKYLHADVKTLERIKVIQGLRSGEFSVLVGVNLLREGLDMPEVTMVAILDADKEGFLRSTTALLQICGRAARNSEGRVVMYADKQTEAIKTTCDITQRRRQLQQEYNEQHGIVPTTIKKAVTQVFADEQQMAVCKPEEVTSRIEEYKKKMEEAAEEMRYEEAAKYRDLMQQYQALEMNID